MASSHVITKPTLEAATVYLLQNQQITLEELKLKLRRQGIKASKSKLVRIAIELLGEQNFRATIEQLKKDRAE